jgi:hypothetical protein
MTEPSRPTTTAPTGGLPATKDSQASVNASRQGIDNSTHCVRASSTMTFILALLPTSQGKANRTLSRHTSFLT